MPPPSCNPVDLLRSSAAKTMHCMQYATDIKLHVHTYAVGAADIVAREGSSRNRPHSSSSQPRGVSLTVHNPCISRAHIGTLTHRTSSIVMSTLSIVAWTSSLGNRHIARPIGPLYFSHLHMCEIFPKSRKPCYFGILLHMEYA